MGVRTTKERLAEVKAKRQRTKKRMNLLKEMEELLQEYQELTEEMLLELEQTAPINESKK